MIDANLSALRQTRPHEYLLRFVFGGLCTVGTGLIANRFGPVIGGLFLAFPAIFPAGIMLIASHEKKRKAEIGCDGTQRGRMAASLDAAGAALGCIALAAFAALVWVGLQRYPPTLVITVAAVLWITVATLAWMAHRSRAFARRQVRRAVKTPRPGAGTRGG